MDHKMLIDGEPHGGTGSNDVVEPATGKKILAGATGTLKRLTLELGGYDLIIVLDDIGVQMVASAIYRSATIDIGQTCLATTPVHALKSLYDKLCEASAGDGLEQGMPRNLIQNRARFGNATTVGRGEVDRLPGPAAGRRIDRRLPAGCLSAHGRSWRVHRRRASVAMHLAAMAAQFK